MGDPTSATPALQMLRGTGLDTSNGSAFIQKRIAQFAGIVTLVALSHVVVGLVFVPVLHIPLGRVVVQHSYLTGAAVTVAMWLVCRRGSLSLPTLTRIDSIGLVASCTGWLVPLLWHPAFVDYLGATLAVTVTVTTRAALVPSKPGRTLRLTSLAFVPLLAVAGWGTRVPPGPEWPPGLWYALVVGVSLLTWTLTAIVLSTITSSIMYGLRQSVREARELGQYTLEERLGIGGMGEVWRARHRLLMRPAAVKIIRLDSLGSGRADPAVLLRRFEREAHATAALRSPHTVALYDFGQAEDGTVYYVMELLVGMDLETLVERFGPVPAERVVHMLRQVCHSLDEAHRNGLTHRDIKPANIFVSWEGTELDFVKVLDFGLVRLRHDRPGRDDVKLTAEGAASGTPAYMAPEIVVGEDAYDHRVDIYALGCVGYWLLTGKLVFEGTTAMKVMMDHVRTPPPRPQSRTELPIPPELEDILLECLEKDPARRPASAAELGRRLAAVPLATPWTAERAERWWATHAPDHTPPRPLADMLLSREGSAHATRELKPRRFAPRAQ